MSVNGNCKGDIDGYDWMFWFQVDVVSKIEN